MTELEMAKAAGKNLQVTLKNGNIINGCGKSTNKVKKF